MDDFINQRRSQQDAPAPPKRGGCLRRFLLGSLLLFAVLACVFFWFTHNTRSKPPYSTALELILSDPQLIEYLGEPISDRRWLPTSGYPKQFQMQVEGPKGLADISVSAGEFDGKWELTAVDVFVREGSKRFSIDRGDGGAGDAPTWSGGSTTGGEKTGEIGLEPPAGVDVELPGGGPPGVEINLPDMPPAPES